MGPRAVDASFQIGGGHHAFIAFDFCKSAESAHTCCQGFQLVPTGATTQGAPGAIWITARVSKEHCTGIQAAVS